MGEKIVDREQLGVVVGSVEERFSVSLNRGVVAAGDGTSEGLGGAVGAQVFKA